MYINNKTSGIKGSISVMFAQSVLSTRHTP